MKTIFSKNSLKLALVVLIGGFMFISCDRSLNSSFVNNVQSGPNLALFKKAKKSVTHISNGKVYDIGIKMWVAGPHMKDVSGDIKVSIKPTFVGLTDSVLNAKKAIKAKEGVNFSIPNSTFTLKESNNYLGTFHIKMLTKGVIAFGKKKQPIVKLKVASAEGSPSVIASGKPILVKLNYGCNSQMAGTYKVVSSKRPATGTVYAPPAHKALVKPDPGIGQYHTTSVGGWFKGSSFRPGGYASFKFGVKFSDVCGNLNVKPTILGGVFGNKVKPQGQTEAVPKIGATNGTLKSFTLKYSINFGGTDYTYIDKYVKQGPLPSKAFPKAESKESVKTAQEKENLPKAHIITSH